jgi:catechol 2,3-dioxygenase-like lactoylglutathione lyase family enzyme
VSVRGLDHVSVTCADLDRSLAFYNGVLGIPVRDRGELAGPEIDAALGHDGVDAAFADLELGEGRTLELLQYRTPHGAPLHVEVHRPGAGHLALRVDDLDAFADRLTEAGFAPGTAVTLDEPRSFWHGARILYVQDPDGAVVELIQRP